VAANETLVTEQSLRELFPAVDFVNGSFAPTVGEADKTGGPAGGFAAVSETDQGSQDSSGTISIVPTGVKRREI
jgi:hypothetical protein